MTIASSPEVAMSMRRLCGLIALSLWALPGLALDADELIAKNIQAKGGIDKMRAIQSLRLSGKLAVNGGTFELALVQVNKRPASVRTDATLQGLTLIQAYDGKEAWQVQPFGGRRDPDRMSADDAKPLIEQADIDGPLVDYKRKGNRVEYLGIEDVDGTEAHKLKVTESNGDVLYYYFDPDYFLEIRIVAQRTVRGTPAYSETDVGNYELVEGVYLPFAIESGPKGGSPDSKAKITFDKAEVNVEVDDASFHFPESAKAAAH
jgi:hypothetical protein